MSRKKQGEPIPEDKRELARAMLEVGKTYREVSDALDVSIGSVHNIMKEDMPDIMPLVEAIKARLASKHYMLADYILSHI
jgi:hypothetical protein